MSDNLIISQYPITDNTRRVISEKLDGLTDFLVISHFAHTGYLNLFRQIRLLNCSKLFVYTGSTENHITLPIFRTMACMIKADRRYVINEMAEFVAWNWKNVCIDFLWMFWSFISGLFAIFASVVFLKFIHYKGRVQVSVDEAMKSKHILYIRPTLWQGLQAGGAITHSRGVIQGFIQNGFNVMCIADSNFVDFSDSASELRTLQPSKAYILPRELNYFNFQWEFIRRTLKIIGKGYNGIIYQRLSVGGFAGVALSRIWRAPLIVEYNGNEAWLARNWGSVFFFESIVDTVEKLILSQAHLTVTVSEALKQDLIERGVQSSRIVVCPNGVNLDQFALNNYSAKSLHTTREKLGFDEDAIIYTFVGTFGAWHGAILLADVILNILKMERDGGDPVINRIRFLLVGNGVEFSEVSRLLKSAIIEGRVVMTGLVDPSEVPKLLAISDICLSPTLGNKDGTEFFGSPTKLFEYMAAGKPVIASAVGQLQDVLSGSPEISSNGDRLNFDNKKLKQTLGAGILTPPGDMNAIKSAILELAHNRVLRDVLSGNARLRAEQKHSWLQHVADITYALEKIGQTNKSSRIVLLINALHAKSGGGVTYIRNMLPHLVTSADIDVHIVLQNNQMPLFEGYFDRATIHTLGNQNSFFEMILTEQFALPKLAKALNVDVIFSTANYGPLISENTVILLRNSLEVASVEKRFRKLAYWFALTAATITSIIRAREVIAVSVYARDASISGIFKKFRESVSIVPHGISDVFMGVINKGSPEPFILTVSDIYVQKNIETLVRGFAMQLQTRPALKLLIAGRPIDEDYYNHIKTIINKLDIAGSISFLGHVEQRQLQDLYETCSVFVFPSTVETFGNPLVEAMACGCPIVCSNAAAMPEVAGDAVIYFDPNSPEEISAALNRMLDDEMLRAEYSRRAKRRASNYSWEESAKKTVNVIMRAAK